jgi:ssDNA-binding replication factor A large subunit
MDLQAILQELERRSGLSHEELLARLKQKQSELSGLISLEGAAYLVAKDLGVELPKEPLKPLQIGNIVSGMRRVNLIGRIFKISPLREFERSNGARGKVVNLWVGDSTGYVRVALWDRQTDLVTEERIGIGDLIHLSNGIARENVFGDVEIRLGRYGRITKLQEPHDIPPAQQLNQRFFQTIERVEIGGVVPGLFEVKGTVVHVFKGNFLFDTCSVCGRRVTNGCVEHVDAKPTPALVISGIVDDGTGNLRFVLFREQAQKFISKPLKELKQLDADQRYELISKELLGRDILIKGRVRKNPRTGRLEMLANEAMDINILDESKRLVEGLERGLG